MKNKLLTLLFLCAIGCSTIEKGEDPVLVRTEQAAGIAYVTMDTYLMYVNHNRSELSDREVDLANKIQVWGKAWIKNMHNSLEDYKKTGEDGYRDMAISFLLKIDDLLLEIRAMEAERGDQ